MLSKVYSLDGESGWTEDEGEIMDKLLSEGVEYGYYVGDKIERKASSFFDVDSFLGTLQENAEEFGGEYSENFKDIDGEAKAAVTALVSQWLDSNLKVNFYSVANATLIHLSGEKVTQLMGEE